MDGMGPGYSIQNHLSLYSSSEVCQRPPLIRVQFTSRNVSANKRLIWRRKSTFWGDLWWSLLLRYTQVFKHQKLTESDRIRICVVWTIFHWGCLFPQFVGDPKGIYGENSFLAETDSPLPVFELTRVIGWDLEFGDSLASLWFVHQTSSDIESCLNTGKPEDRLKVENRFPSYKWINILPT